MKVVRFLFTLLILVSFTIKAQDVTIGKQTWTSKNLNVSTYRNGDAIPQVQDNTAWENLTTGAWCYYENKTANGTTYGKLYNWYAVNDARGLAPKGYHIPTVEEWSITIHEPGDFTKITGLPGGRRAGNGDFGIIGSNGYWWDSSAYNTDNIPFHTMEPYDDDLYELEKYSDLYDMEKYLKHFGFSVRCIKD